MGSKSARHIDFTVGGETLKLRFTTNAMVMFEEAYGQNFTVVEAWAQSVNAGSVSIRCLRALIYAGVSGSTPISLMRAGEIIDEVGFQPAMAAVMDAIQLAFPAPSSSEIAVGNEQAEVDPA